MVRVKRELLLEVVDDLGLFVQLSYVHQPLGELPPTCVHSLVPHRHLPPGVHHLLFGQRHITHPNQFSVTHLPYVDLKHLLITPRFDSAKIKLIYSPPTHTPRRKVTKRTTPPPSPSPPTQSPFDLSHQFEPLPLTL